MILLQSDNIQGKNVTLDLWYTVVVVYYESIKRELKRRLINECRCDERLSRCSLWIGKATVWSPEHTYISFSYHFLSFICSRIKKRRKPRVKIVTLKLCGVGESKYLYKHPTTWKNTCFFFFFSFSLLRKCFHFYWSRCRECIKHIT